MNKKRIFLSGPMTGIEKYNFPKFDKFEQDLKGLENAEVVNPANIARKYKVVEVLNNKEIFDKMIEEELDALKTCNCIFLLNGWEKTKGAKRELKVALENDLEIMLEKTGE